MHGFGCCFHLVLEGSMRIKMRETFRSSVGRWRHMIRKSALEIFQNVWIRPQLWQSLVDSAFHDGNVCLFPSLPFPSLLHFPFPFPSILLFHSRFSIFRLQFPCAPFRRSSFPSFPSLPLPFPFSVSPFPVPPYSPVSFRPFSSLTIPFPVIYSLSFNSLSPFTFPSPLPLTFLPSIPWCESARRCFVFPSSSGSI